MRSRKLQALDFILGYFARWGGSPSLEEIASALSVTRQSAHYLVKQLAADGRVLHTPGVHRGLRLVDPQAAISLAQALLVLRRCGVLKDAPLTDEELTGLPVLDHDPGSAPEDPDHDASAQ